MSKTLFLNVLFGCFKRYCHSIVLVMLDVLSRGYSDTEILILLTVVLPSENLSVALKFMLHYVNGNNKLRPAAEACIEICCKNNFTLWVF
jgi:hypothetical protein